MSLLLALQGAAPAEPDSIQSCIDDFVEFEEFDGDGWIGAVPDDVPVIVAVGEAPDEEEDELAESVFTPFDYIAELIAGGGENPPEEDDAELFDWLSQPIEDAAAPPAEPDFITSCLDDQEEDDSEGQDWQSEPVEEAAVAPPDFITSCLDDQQDEGEIEQDWLGQLVEDAAVAPTDDFITSCLDDQSEVEEESGDWQSGPFEEAPNRSGRSSRLKRIIDAKLTLKGTYSRSSVGKVVVEVHNVEHYVPPVHGYATVRSSPTYTTTGRCTVTVSAIISVHQTQTRAKVNGIDWLLSYSKVRVSGSTTKSSFGKVSTHSSSYVYLTPSAEVTSYGKVDAYGTKNLTPQEIVQAIHAIRKLRKKT